MVNRFMIKVTLCEIRQTFTYLVISTTRNQNLIQYLKVKKKYIKNINQDYFFKSIEWNEFLIVNVKSVRLKLFTSVKSLFLTDPNLLTILRNLNFYSADVVQT